MASVWLMRPTTCVYIYVYVYFIAYQFRELLYARVLRIKRQTIKSVMIRTKFHVWLNYTFVKINTDIPLAGGIFFNETNAISTSARVNIFERSFPEEQYFFCAASVQFGCDKTKSTFFLGRQIIVGPLRSGKQSAAIIQFRWRGERNEICATW